MEEQKKSPPLHQFLRPPLVRGNPRVPLPSEAYVNLNVVICKHLIARLEQWTQGVHSLSTETPEPAGVCQQIALLYHTLSHSLDGEAWELLQQIPPEDSGPLALALTNSHAQAELAYFSVVVPGLAWRHLPWLNPPRLPKSLRSQ